MKGSKLIGQIDSFKNKQEIGLFTFYIQTSKPNSTISFNDVAQQHKQKNSKDLKTIDHQNYQIKKIGQYRINSKPERRLKTLQACSNSYYLVEKNNQTIDKKDLSINSNEQFDQVKELFNLKRQNNKKLLQELLIKNQVDSQILYRFTRKKELINPDKLVRSKKCSLNGFPKHTGPFKSGYLSNVAKKMSKSYQKSDKISKNFSEQLISPKQKLSLHQIKAFNDQLDVQFKLQQQRFRPGLFPSYKKRYSSYLKESQLSQMHPYSNDSLIQKLKNNNKLLQTKEKSQQKIPLNISKTFLLQKENQSVKVSQQKGKIKNQIVIPSEKSLVNKLSNRNFQPSQIDFLYLPRERLSCLQKNNKKLHDQRERNNSEIQARNSYDSFRNFSKLEKISRPLNKKINESQDLCRKKQKISKLPKNQEQSNKLQQSKKNLLIIVKKVKDKYVSI